MTNKPNKKLVAHGVPTTRQGVALNLHLCSTVGHSFVSAGTPGEAAGTEGAA